MHTDYDVWTYPTELRADANLEGFKVEALDGSIGKIDEASNEVGARYVVVDTGPWIFGKKVMLPAGVIDSVDYDTETVYVNRDKDTIKNSPEFDPDAFQGDEYRTRLGGYYSPGGAGYRETTSGRDRV